MNDETQVAEELYAFARAIVAKRTRRRGGRHWQEDAAQELVLAGWQVYRDTGNIGLAKHRMTDRLKNLLRDADSEQEHEPKPESAFQEPSGEEPGLLEAAAGNRRDDPVETAIVREYLAKLPERRRRVVQLRMAGYSAQEIADQLGVSLRTVERELELARKYYLEKFQ